MFLNSKYFLKFFFFIMCVCVYLHSQGPKASDLPGVGVRGSCELPYLGAGNQTWILLDLHGLDCWAISPAQTAGILNRQNNFLKNLQIKHCKTTEICKRKSEQMEICTMLLNLKVQYCKDVKFPQINLYSQQYQSKFNQDLSIGKTS